MKAAFDEMMATGRDRVRQERVFRQKTLAPAFVRWQELHRASTAGRCRARSAQTWARHDDHLPKLTCKSSEHCSHSARLHAGRERACGCDGSPPAPKRRPAVVPGFRQWQPRNGRRCGPGGMTMTVQAITSEAAQAAVSPTRGATAHRTARAATGGKRKNLAKNNIAKPRAAGGARTNEALAGQVRSFSLQS